MINKDDNEINFKRYSGDYLYSNYRKNVIEDNLYEDDEDDNYKSDELLNSVENEIIEDEKEIKQKKVVYYCPQYDDIKSNPNKIWMYYDERIKKTLKVMSYWKSFDIDDLYQQAYIHFIELSKTYLPYYNNKFYPFDRYIFKNIIIKLRAYIQNYYLKSKREQPTEFSERTLGGAIYDDIKDADNRLMVQQIYNDLTQRQIDILDLSYKGYKQQEVGEILDISQSRVSVIKKKTIKALREHFTEEELKEKLENNKKK